MLNPRGDQKPATVRELLHETVTTLYELTAALPTDEPLRASIRHEALEAVRYAEHAALEPKDLVFFAASLGTLIAYCRLAALQHHSEFDAVALVLSSIRDTLGSKAQARRMTVDTGTPAPSTRRSPAKPRAKRSASTKTSQRQRTLLNFLLQHPGVQLAQLVGQFPGISDRTIRRDIEALRRDGFVQREGTTSNALYRADAEKVRTLLK